MEAAGEMVQVGGQQELNAQCQAWSVPTDDAPSDGRRPLAYLLSLEGADPLIDLSYLEPLVQQGLRAVGPVHYGTGRYGYGTNATGKFPPEGRQLLNLIGD